MIAIDPDEGTGRWVHRTDVRERAGCRHRERRRAAAAHGNTMDEGHGVARELEAVEIERRGPEATVAPEHDVAGVEITRIGAAGQKPRRRRARWHHRDA